MILNVLALKNAPLIVNAAARKEKNVIAIKNKNVPLIVSAAARKGKNAAAINLKRQIITIKHPNTLNTIKNTALQNNYKNDNARI